MMPTTLAGAQIGALILVIFPSLVIQVILTLKLAFLWIFMYRKAVKLTKKETELMKSIAEVVPDEKVPEEAHENKEQNEENDASESMQPIIV